MRKLLAAVAVCLLCCPVTFAQKIKGKTFFGLKTGINISTFRTAVDYPGFDPSLKVGYALGGFVEIPLKSRFYLQPEFLYSQMGSKGSSSQWGTVTFRYNYFSLPLILKYKISETFSFLAGPQADFLIRARKKDIFKTESITYVIKDYDLGFTAGAEAWFSKKVSLTARYIHGIRDVSLTSDQNTFFNQGLQIAVGYKLYAKTKKPKGK
jgi:Outer membrane protein beta-barrel domain